MVLGVFRFDGARRIDGLNAFLFRYHPHEKEVKDYLIECGQLVLPGIHRPGIR